MKQEPFVFRSPIHDRYPIAVPPEAALLTQKFNGTIASSGGDEYEIRNNVIDLIGNTKIEKTLAQSTNFSTFTAEIYESVWRKHSIGLLSGEKFSIADEQVLLTSWLKPLPGQRYLDIGCSTALYARTIANAETRATVAALDFSPTMLSAARDKSVADGVNLFLVCADAAHLPFFSGTFHGLVCGGTLNEFINPDKALSEARRVIMPGGLFFIMYLLKSESVIGRTLQFASSTSGLRFWTIDESRNLFSDFGFKIKKEERKGIVHFCLLEAV